MRLGVGDSEIVAEGVRVPVVEAVDVGVELCVADGVPEPLGVWVKEGVLLRVRVWVCDCVPVIEAVRDWLGDPVVVHV